jgi:hypothetical protein
MRSPLRTQRDGADTEAIVLIHIGGGAAKHYAAI